MDYKDLDIVLKALNHNEPIYENIFQISARLPKENEYFIVTERDAGGDNINAKRLLLILGKLCQDGFIERHTKGKIESFYKFNINYNGVEFIAQGCYEERLRLNTLKEEKIRKGEMLVLLVKIASVVVGSYYLLMLVKLIVYFSCCYH